MFKLDETAFCESQRGHVAGVALSGQVSNRNSENTESLSWEEPREAISFADSIAGKITLRSLLLAATPVLIVGLLTIISLFLLSRSAGNNLDESRTELVQSAVGERRAEQADLVLDKMDSYIAERVNDVIDWSRTTEVRAAATANYPAIEDLEGLSIDEIEARFDARRSLDVDGSTAVFLQQQIQGRLVEDDTPELTDNRLIYAEVLFTEANGYIVGATGLTSDFVQSDEEWWQIAWEQGIFIDQLAFDESANANSFDVSVRIDDNRGQPIGVMKVSIDASVLQVFADDFARDDVEVRVVSSSGLILADTASDHQLVGEDASISAIFQNEQAIAFNTAKESLDSSGFLSYENTVFGFSKTSDTRRIERLGLDVENQSWLSFVEQPSESAFRPLDGLADVQNELNFSTLFLTLVIGGLIIITLLLAYLVSRLVANRIAGPINDLRAEANWVADYQLPELVSVLQDPTTNTIPAVEPIDVGTGGEVGELASAFNAVRSTAIELAGNQAIGRSRDVAGILMNLGRRNQQLIGRQLQFIDQLEQSESDPDTLRNLFLLDQMTTRMRRNAESLLVLAGEDSPRRGTAPLAIEDVIRAASGEVEDYARVQIDSVESVMVRPDVVSDLTHLLAELIENAASFSPPDTDVEIVGSQGFDGSYTISIVDHGVGMTREKMEEANRRLASPSFSEGVSTSFLGLFVVGRLAGRHGINARLVESATSGITAKIGLPASCMANETGDNAGFLDRQLAPVGALPAAPQELSAGTTGQMQQLAPPPAQFTPPSEPASYPPPQPYSPPAPAEPGVPIGFDDLGLDPLPVEVGENEVPLPQTEVRRPGAQTPGSLPGGINLQTPYGGAPATGDADTGDTNFDAHADGGVPSVLPASPTPAAAPSTAVAELPADLDGGDVPIPPFEKRESKAPVAGETVTWVAGDKDEADRHTAVGDDASPEEVEDKAERARTLLNSFTRGQKQAINGSPEETE